MAGHLMDQGGIKDVLSTQMHNPVFPIPIEAMQANMEFKGFEAGDSFQLFDGDRNSNKIRRLRNGILFDPGQGFSGLHAGAC